MVDYGKLAWCVLSWLAFASLGCGESKRDYGKPGSGEGGAPNAEGGAAGEGNGPGSGGDGGSGPVVSKPGDPCTEDGALQCAGTNQRARLECTDGSWQPSNECEEDERCDTSNDAAECKPVLDECADKAAGEGVCAGLVRSDCGPDLVTLENSETCDLFCVEHGGTAECSACEAEQYSADGTPDGCTAWTTCESGQFVSTNGSATSDRECADCEDGFSDTENAASCTPWTTCTWQLGGLVDEGTSITDAVCGTASPYRQFGTTADDSTSAVATDSSGNVYVAGTTQGSLAGPATIRSAYLRKYDPSGGVLWTKQFGTGGGPAGTVALALAVDKNDNVYLGGYTALELDGTSAGGVDAFLRKYSPSGDVTWARQFGTSSEDGAYGLSTDANGDVYVAGLTRGTLTGMNAGGADGFLRKYDASGAVVWTRQWGTSSQEWATDVNVNGTQVAVSSGQNSLGEVRAYATNGDYKWALVISVDFEASARGVTVLGNGDVYVVGSTTGDLQGTHAGNGDAYLRKYAANGVTAWTRQFGTPAGDSAEAVAIDASENMYVLGYAQDALTGTHAGSYDVFLRKYDPTGTEVWTEQFGNSSSDMPAGLSLDGDGNLYVAGSTQGAFVGMNLGLYDVFLKQILPTNP
jgi:hypothetical protein